jgi:hypothetical protein
MTPTSSREHGLPTASVVRSSQATPARRRGQACSGVPPRKHIAFGAVLPTPAMLAGVDNTVGFNANVDDRATMHPVTRARSDRP